MPQPQQRRAWALSEIYTTGHGNAGSLTHWARSGIKSTTSWLLVGFVSAVPQWELWKDSLILGTLWKTLEKDSDCSGWITWSLACPAGMGIGLANSTRGYVWRGEAPWSLEKGVLFPERGRCAGQTSGNCPLQPRSIDQHWFLSDEKAKS